MGRSTPWWCHNVIFQWTPTEVLDFFHSQPRCCILRKASVVGSLTGAVSEDALFTAKTKKLGPQLS